MAKKRSVNPSEHAIQSAFIEWVKLCERIEPRLKLSFCVPNGGARNIVTATMMKREGVKRGVPDWLCPVSVCSNNQTYFWSGLAIEFKKRGGIVSPEQKEMILLFKQYEWSVYICYTTEEAIECVKKYFSMK